MIQRKSLIQGLAIRKPSKQQDLALIKKSAVPEMSAKVKGTKLLSTLEEVSNEIVKKLSVYRGKVDLLRSEQAVVEYFDAIIENGICALDTETTGLDCLNDLVVGTCLYTPGKKAVYIPHKHVSYITGNLLKNQVTYEFLSEQLKRLIEHNVKFVYHNAKFDVRMIESNCHVLLPVYWDTQIAAQLLNNLESHSLKYQYSAKILHSAKTYDYSYLFKGVNFAQIAPDYACLYAATDSLITHELYEFQKEEFKKYPGIYKVYTEIELKVLPQVIAMEDTGVYMDLERAKELSVKYNALLKEAEKDVYAELKTYSSQIALYRSKNPNCKLSQPINIGSPTQLGILLYDILCIGVVDPKKPRGTDEPTLSQIKLPICDKILKYRELSKLIGTYIDNIPQKVDKNGRLHAEFNQLGASTGRFSSSNPNLQNIPSHNNEIRTMFSATTDYGVCETENDCFEVRRIDSVLTNNGYVRVTKLRVGDIICNDTENYKILKIENNNDKVLLYV